MVPQRVVVPVFVLLLLVGVVFAGCLAPDGIRSMSSRMSPEVPLNIGMSTEGHLLRGPGTTWTLSVSHGGEPGWGAIEYDASCDGPIDLSLSPVPGGSTPGQPSLPRGVAGTLAWRAPGDCQDAPRLERIEPGGTSEVSWQWNATLWNATSESFEEAPAGTYAWDVVWTGRHLDATGAPNETVSPRGTFEFTFVR